MLVSSKCDPFWWSFFAFCPGQVALKSHRENFILCVVCTPIWEKTILNIRGACFSDSDDMGNPEMDGRFEADLLLSKIPSIHTIEI